MYKYVSPNNEFLNELKQVDTSLIVEMILMLPTEYDKNIRIIEHGIDTGNYEEIHRGVHSIKTNLRYFIDIDNPLIVFYQDFLTRTKDKWLEQKKFGRVEKDVDFMPDLIKMKELSREPIEEIMRFKDDFEKSSS